MGEVSTEDLSVKTSRTPMIVEYLVQEQGLGETIPRETQQLIISSISQLVLPIEQEYEGTWNRNARKVDIAKKALLGKLGNDLEREEQEVTPEIDTLRQIIQDHKGKYGVYKRDSQRLIEGVVGDTVRALSSGFKSRDDLQKYLRPNQYGPTYSGSTRHTRGTGIDVNPPQSRDEWRPE